MTRGKAVSIPFGVSQDLDIAIGNALLRSIPAKPAERWQIKTEPFTGISIHLKGKPAAKPKKTTYVLYRPAGTRGRWRRFVLKGRVPRDLQALVEAFEAKGVR